MSSLAFSEINSNDNLADSNTLLNRARGKHNTTIKKRINQNIEGGGTTNENVQSMLKIINNTNGYDDINDDNGGLADFNPPPRAEVSSKQPSSPSAAAAPSTNKREIEIDYEKPSNYTAPSTENEMSVKSREYPKPLDSYNDFNALPKTYATDYYKQYVPYFGTNGGVQNKDHLLEEQKDEKTGHVMEEIILYSFLGVFIIFIVDSFARAGKYTR